MSSQAPLAESAHQRVMRLVRERVRDGHWRAGEMLPGRRSLAKEFSVSVATIDRAIQPLYTEGIIWSDDRRGTYVAYPEDKSTDLDHSASAPQELTDRELTVGIVVTFGQFPSQGFDQTEYWNRLMTDTIEQELMQDGHRTTIVNRAPIGSRSPVPLAETVPIILERALDGVVIVCLDLEPEVVDAALERLDPQDLPVVIITIGELTRPFSHVVADDFKNGYLVAQHLLKTGHKTIDVFVPFRARWSENRLDGIQSAVKHQRLPADTVRVFRGEDKPWVYEGPQLPQTQAAIRMALEAGWRYEGAIIAIHDFVAFCLIYEGLTFGFLPGRDYAVAGFDDHPTARLCGMTSVRPPLKAMAREAARLINRNMPRRQEAMVVRIQGELVARSSTVNNGGQRRSIDDYGQILSAEFRCLWNPDRRFGESIGNS